MGAYTWVSKQELERYSVLSNKDLNECFQEVRELMPHVYISERITESKSFFGKKTVNTTYSIYHLVGDKVTEHSEVRCLNLNCTTAPHVFNYLCGLLNGFYCKLKVSQIEN